MHSSSLSTFSKHTECPNQLPTVAPCTGRPPKTDVPSSSGGKGAEESSDPVGSSSEPEGKGSEGGESSSLYSLESDTGNSSGGSSGGGQGGGAQKRTRRTSGGGGGRGRANGSKQARRGARKVRGVGRPRAQPLP